MFIVQVFPLSDKLSKHEATCSCSPTAAAGGVLNLNNCKWKIFAGFCPRQLSLSVPLPDINLSERELWRPQEVDKVEEEISGVRTLPYLTASLLHLPQFYELNIQSNYP